MQFADTIIAPITPVGGAVCVIRISGPDAHSIGNALLEQPIDSPEERHTYHAQFGNGDDGLITFFADDRSYTGEPTVEVSVHGSPASVGTLCQLAYSAGARPADAGEFTMRSFMNGKLDLSQAEAVRALVEAETERQLNGASAVKAGALTSRLEEAKKPTQRVLAAVEAHTDFSEEIGEVDETSLLNDLSEASRSVSAILEESSAAVIIRDGARVAIVGLPNAGKSSLFNAVVGSERAIVTATPGTTRDTIEQRIDLDGYLVILVDTAGVRDQPDDVERIGIERSIKEIEGADIVWHVFDAAAPPGAKEELEQYLEGRPVIRVASKIDLPNATIPQGAIGVSSTHGKGIEGLLDETKKHFPREGLALAVSRRQHDVLRSLLDSIEAASDSLAADVPLDLCAVHLREALHQLGLIDGTAADADLLDSIFSEFCIGK